MAATTIEATSGIIDVHVHLGKTVVRLPLQQQTPEHYLVVMRKLGISAAFIAPASGYDLSDGMAATRRENDSVATIHSRWPSQFPVGLAILELRLGVENATNEIARCLLSLGLSGVCCVPRFSGFPLGEAIVPSLEVLNRRAGVLMLHTEPTTVQFVAKYANVYPNCIMVVSHAQRYPLRNVLNLSPFGNVYIDITQDPQDAQLSRRVLPLISRFPCERILFGTDAPYYSPEAAVANFLRLDISSDLKDKIARHNAERLLARLRS